MACECGANSWEHVGAARCGAIRCTVCGYLASPENVRAYRKTKAETKTKTKESENI